MLPAGMKRPSGRVKPGSGTMIEVLEVFVHSRGGLRSLELMSCFVDRNV